MPTDPRPTHFRTSFDQVAEEYDAERPGYPPALIDDIVALAALPSPARILEIGCGTGQATQPFAERGDRLLCLDIGAAMLAVARRKFAKYPQIAFHHGAFEEWPMQAGTFDLVLSATAFHWIPPEIGYPKAAEALKPTGSMAIFAHEHLPLDPAFAADLYAIEQELAPDWPDPRFPPDLLTTIAASAAAIDATSLFAPTIVKTYPWMRSYSADEFVRLHNTFSNYRSLSDFTRAELFRAIAELIERHYAGTITKSYLAVLYLAHKR